MVPFWLEACRDAMLISLEVKKVSWLFPLPLTQTPVILVCRLNWDSGDAHQLHAKYRDAQKTIHRRPIGATRCCRPDTERASRPSRGRLHGGGRQQHRGHGVRSDPVVGDPRWEAGDVGRG